MENLPTRVRGRDISKTGSTVARNLKRLRGDLSLRDLEDRLEALEVKISSSGLQKIESGSRRVDADEIVALAVALNVNPNALLLPPHIDDPDISSEVTAVSEGTTGDDIWAWADGWRALPQHRANAPEIEASASGMERGRQLARQRRVSEGWDFLERIRPLDEDREDREFMIEFRERLEDLQPGQWVTLWLHSSKDPQAFLLHEYPVFTYQRGAAVEIEQHMRNRLAGLLREPNNAHYLETVLKDLEDNGND